LQALMVLYTEDIGGILTLSYDDEGNLYFSTTAADNDYDYDEIGSQLKIRQYQEKYKELLEDLEEYYQAFFCKCQHGFKYSVHKNKHRKLCSVLLL
ncbi:MAG: hypothetical protein IJS24_00750, partial [Eubacterium sp.]|nr:hypothetical protein [Eubacterium sp.]